MTEENSFNNQISDANSNAEQNTDSQEEYVKEASDFIEKTSLDKMLEIAEIARLKKMTQPTEPKWIIPDDI